MPKNIEELTSSSRVDFASAIVETYKILSKIEALCENPYWTADRRWRIADLARKARTTLEGPR